MAYALWVSPETAPPSFEKGILPLTPTSMVRLCSFSSSDRAFFLLLEREPFVWSN
jgi:hypothetical protein